MANKDYSVTLTMTFSVSASNEEKAQERAEAVEQALLEGKWPKFSKSWCGDLESQVEIEEA